MDTSKIRKKRKLSLKQKRFVDNYIVHGNSSKAVLQAGYNVKDIRNARRIGWANLQKPKIIEAMEAALEKAHLDESYLAGTLKEIIESGKARKVTAQEALKAIDMVFKVKGSYAPEKKQIAQVSIKAELMGKSREELEEELKRIGEEKDRLLKKYKNYANSKKTKKESN